MVKGGLMYNGKKYELSDGKGNVLERSDDRVLAEEVRERLKELDKVFTDTYHKKLGFESKEKGNRKMLEARAGVLTDKTEQQELLSKATIINAEYTARKNKILSAKTCDECHNAVHEI